MIDEEKFEIVGAGEIAISTDANHFCGDRAGFSFRASWAKYPYAGGVIPRMEAIRLAEYILERCADLPLTERQQVEEFNKHMFGK